MLWNRYMQTLIILETRLNPHFAFQRNLWTKNVAATKILMPLKKNQQATCIDSHQLHSSDESEILRMSGAFGKFPKVKGSVSLKVSTSSTNGQRHYSNAINPSAQNIKKKKKMAKLNDEERIEQLQPLLDAGWKVVDDRDAIHKEYLFTDFNQAFSFMTGVSLLAEKMNHHPEWFNVYNKVQVTMSTHDVGGLSSKDIQMANYMEDQAKKLSLMWY